jgi:F-type H+-transporting ATPase subunit b
MMTIRIRRILTVALSGAIACLAAPGAAWAAEAEGDRWGVFLPLGRLLNLILVIAVLIWVARKPLSSFFASRSQAIRDQLAEAQQARKEAEAKLAEIEARMSSLDDELAGIKAAAEQEAQAEQQRLVAEAERDAQKVVERARREIEGMTRAAQLELRSHAAELAVQLAEQKIRQEMTEDDRSRLFARFVAGLGGDK